MKTRAAIIEEKGGRLRLEELDLADPGPGDVRVKMEACGICRSDVHAIVGGESVRFPAVLGHEGAGIIEALAGDVHGLAEGDRVILSSAPACGGCPPCRRGDVQLCRGLRMSISGDGLLGRITGWTSSWHWAR